MSRAPYSPLSGVLYPYPAPKVFDYALYMRTVIIMLKSLTRAIDTLSRDMSGKPDIATLYNL